MIATTLSGGIGNQLFMYATAKAMALRNETELVINNTTDFAKDSVYHRQYELDVFNFSFKKNRFLTFDYPGGNLIKKICRKVGRNIFCPQYIFFIDKFNNHKYNPALLEIRNTCIYLEGYWHSELYFKDYEKTIREELAFDFVKSDMLIMEENEIFNQPNITPICIGVRRYEEAPDPNHFNLTDKDYYLAAMDFFEKRVTNPVFFLFTQAKEWVNNNLCHSGHDIRFIKDKQNNGTVEDLYLMSRFKYHIISNSSYYWWGAWLANGETVVSCRNWFNDKANCESWILI